LTTILRGSTLAILISGFLLEPNRRRVLEDRFTGLGHDHQLGSLRYRAASFARSRSMNTPCHAHVRPASSLVFSSYIVDLL
jgi:hypothetical protein